MNNLKRNLDTKYQYIGFLPKSVRIKENGFWGINDFDGNEILPSNFIEVFTLSTGSRLIAARDAGYWNIYDFHGNKLNSERYDYIYPYYGMFGVTKVKVGDKWGLLNKYGRIILQIKYKKIEKFGRGIVLYNFDSEPEFIDRADLIKLLEVNVFNLSTEAKKPAYKKTINFSPKKSRVL